MHGRSYRKGELRAILGKLVDTVPTWEITTSKINGKEILLTKKININKEHKMLIKLLEAEDVAEVAQRVKSLETSVDLMIHKLDQADEVSSLKPTVLGKRKRSCSSVPDQEDYEELSINKVKQDLSEGDEPQYPFYK